MNNSPNFNVDPSGLKGNGHHIIPWHIFNGKVPREVFEFFDSDDARIFNDFYKEHNCKTLNGVSHHTYNKLVYEELMTFLGDKKLSDMTLVEAKQFLDHIRSQGGDIGKYLKGVQDEADRALKAGLEQLAKRSVQRSTTVAESGLERLARKGKGALPLFAGLGVSAFFFPKQCEAKGVTTATADEVVDSLPLIEWYKFSIEIMTGRDVFPAKGERGAFEGYPDFNPSDFPPF